jgi:hypothetical protein
MTGLPAGAEHQYLRAVVILVPPDDLCGVDAARLYCARRAEGADPDTAARSTRAAMANATPPPARTVTR